jgi:hypothetical protein
MTGKRRASKGARGPSRDWAAAQDRLRTHAVAPAPERRHANGCAAPPAERAAPSYVEPRASRDEVERRGSFDQQPTLGSAEARPWRNSHDGSVPRPRAVDSMAEECNNTQGQRRPQQAPSYDRGYDRVQQAPPPRGQATPVPNMGARGGAYGQPRYEGDYTWGQALNVRSDCPVDEYGAPARSQQQDGGSGRRGGGSYRQDDDDALLVSIMAEIQQQQARRNPNQSNLQAAMATGGAYPGGGGYPGAAAATW